MTNTDMYAYGKAGLGAASDIYGAWQTGQNYKAQTAAFEQNENQKTQDMYASWNIQEGARDQAFFGGIRAADAHLAAGRSKLKSIGKQLDSNNEQLLMQHNLAYEQSAAVDETIGNMMSRNAIDSMKAEARLRASAAGTGTSGGTTAIATVEADSIQMFDNAVLIGRAEGQKLDIQRRLSMDRLSARNKQLYTASGMSAVFSSNSTSAAFARGQASTYAGISESRKSGYIARDKIQARVNKTWVDTLFNAKDVIINSGMDSALTTMFSQMDNDLTPREIEMNFRKDEAASGLNYG